MADAMAASDAGADFLVLRTELQHEEIRTICELVPVPVYVPGLALEEAWALGATGLSDL
jgi:2-methylisocitrate lyase-like PEP mutase family enzyme